MSEDGEKFKPKRPAYDELKIRITDLLKNAEGGMRLIEITNALEANNSTVRVMAQELVEEGILHFISLKYYYYLNTGFRTVSLVDRVRPARDTIGSKYTRSGIGSGMDSVFMG